MVSSTRRVPRDLTPHPAASYVTGKIIEIDGGAEAPVFPDDTPDLRPGAG